MARKPGSSRELFYGCGRGRSASIGNTGKMGAKQKALVENSFQGDLQLMVTYEPLIMGHGCLCQMCRPSVPSTAPTG